MSTPRTAASLLLLRQPEDPQVLWVRRALHARFLSGFHAFPGGFVEVADGEEPELAARAAALRELREEVGFDAGLRPEALIDAGAWTAPPYLGTPIFTRFFAAWTTGPLPEPRLDPAELIAAAWVRPADALAEWTRGEVLLAPPTQALLTALTAGAPGDRERFLESPHARGEPARFARIRPHITLFPVRTPTLPPATHTNCYVVGDDRLALIDPASADPAEQAALDAYLDARRAAGARVTAVLLTHAHHDHMAGAVHVAERYGAPILAHADAAARLPFPVQGFLDEGDRVELGDHRLTALHTPGHARGHLCYLDAATGSLAAGDMVAGIGTILIEPEEGSMADYLGHLERLRHVGATCLMPAHGGVMGGVDAKLAEYIAHRLLRESRVVEALAAGPRTVTELVPQAYADTPPHIWPLAALSLRTHLQKLAEDGRARLVDAATQTWAPT